MSLETASQSWNGDSPIFFRNGKRVNLETGYNMMIRGHFGRAKYLREWFEQNAVVTASTEPFLIANDCDQPCQKMIVQSGQYIHSSYVGWGKVGTSDRSTHVTLFGFYAILTDKGAYLFGRVNASVAQYEDGKERKWQDLSSFELHPWYFVKKVVQS